MADALMLELYQSRFAEGDKLALIWALERCCREGGEMPPWVADEFCKAVRKVRLFETDTWDDVFGKPHDGRKVTLLKEKHNKRWKVVEIVNRLRRDGAKGDIYQLAADEMKVVSRATAKRYYDEIYRNIEKPEKPKRLRKSQS